jgi:hypothetical protein
MCEEYQQWVQLTKHVFPPEKAEEIIEQMPYERFVKAVPRLLELLEKAKKAIETYGKADIYTTEYEMVVRNGFLTPEEFEEMKELQFLLC